MCFKFPFKSHIPTAKICFPQINLYREQNYNINNLSQGCWSEFPCLVNMEYTECIDKFPRILSSQQEQEVQWLLYLNIEQLLPLPPTHLRKLISAALNVTGLSRLLQVWRPFKTILFYIRCWKNSSYWVKYLDELCFYKSHRIRSQSFFSFTDMDKIIR